MRRITIDFDEGNPVGPWIAAHLDNMLQTSGPSVFTDSNNATWARVETLDSRDDPTTKLATNCFDTTVLQLIMTLAQTGADNLCIQIQQPNEKYGLVIAAATGDAAISIVNALNNREQTGS